MPLSRFYSIFLLLFLFCTELFSQPEIKAIRTEEQPNIDGVLNETLWENAFIINDFVQREPAPGEPSKFKTEVYFLYDTEQLYIGFKCTQNPGDITSKEMARDISLAEDDRVQIILDTYLNGRDGYWFQIGPRGSIGDALVNENGRAFNKSWDGLWEGKTRIHDKGWDAEMAIPFKTIGFDKENDTWGVKLIRYVVKYSESSYWPETSLDADRFQVSDAGIMTGLEGLSQGIGLDIVPYLTGGIGKNVIDGDFSDLDAGLDIFYQLTPSLKIAATLNTDFAQTEADEREINLTRFDLYFPEKRDFFLDGANYFNFGIGGDYRSSQSKSIIPFFSRKIGLNDEGSPVPIQYGGKFTGQAGNWNIGMLHIKDKNEFDNPAYSVVRVSRNLGKQSSVGFIGTNGNSYSENDNSLAGIDVRIASSEIKGNKNLVYNLYGLKSFSTGLSGDETALGTEINFPNDLFNFRLGYMQIGEDFRPGIGFLPRNNIRTNYGSLGFGPRPDQKYGILQIQSGIDYSLISDLKNGGLITAEIELKEFEITMISGDQLEISSHYNYDLLEEDFNVYKDYIIPQDKYYFWWHMIDFSSAKHRNFWISASYGRGNYYNGIRTDWVTKAGYKIFIPLFIGVESDRRYINLETGEFIAQIWRMNLNIFFNPQITWYNFAQYDSESENMGWQSRFQWILKPGKEIFLVWNSPFIEPMERFRSEAYDARLKIKYTLRF